MPERFFDTSIYASIEFSKQKPPPKIRGSQFIKREEKQYPKNIQRPKVPLPKIK